MKKGIGSFKVKIDDTTYEGETFGLDLHLLEQPMTMELKLKKLSMSNVPEKAQEFVCGCVAKDRYTMEYCPLHANAEKMLGLLRELKDRIDHPEQKNLRLWEIIGEVEEIEKEIAGDRND